MPNLTMINNGTIYLDDLDTKRDLRSLAMTTKKYEDDEDRKIPVLQVEVIPGQESNLN